ncbi:hypothetical protein BH23GEM9_BH23GEM9_23000 [soil metagenome]
MRSMATLPARILTGATRLMLWLLPSAFRRRYGAEIAAAVEDCVAAAYRRAGWRAALLAGMRQALDLVRVGAVQRIDQVRYAAASLCSETLRYDVVVRGAVVVATVAAAVLVSHGISPEATPGYYDELIVTAVDPAGPFSLTLRNGRIVAGTVAGEPVPAERLRQTGNDIRIMHDDGRVLLALTFEPPGTVRWEPRTP